MNIDISDLLEPVSADNPAGEELDYDQQFISLIGEMQGTPEQQYGDTLIHAVEPDWARVAREARELLKKSKDFRLAVMLVRAWTRTEGVPGAVMGMQLMRSLAEQYWAAGFPALEFDGEQDPLPRSNALTELTSGNGLVKDLRERVIHSKKLGNVALGALERIHLSREAVGEVPLKRENIIDFLQDELRAGNPDIAALPELARLTKDLKTWISERLDAELLPDFNPLCSFLDCFIRDELVEEGPAQHGAVSASNDNLQPAPAGDSSPYGRKDVIAMLDAVCAYLEEAEPANPAPLLIRRARNMIGKDFVSILKEIAPDGLHQVEMIAGISAKE